MDSGGSATFTRCAFLRNTAVVDMAGAVMASGMSTFVDCIFEENVAADRGGAVEVYSGTATFTRTRFARNRAGFERRDPSLHGQRIARRLPPRGRRRAARPPSTRVSPLTLNGTTVAGHTGNSAINAHGASVTIDGSTFADNSNDFDRSHPLQYRPRPSVP